MTCDSRRLPARSLPTILPIILYLFKSVTIILVPLHTPPSGFRFRKTMIGTPSGASAHTVGSLQGRGSLRPRSEGRPTRRNSPHQ
ncbi:hypothetical protein Micbo1qcDRAFT_170034 [Microdochium bolleyi]|uniref:Uncharacterized protein n=1 Tax=Microdochium bolleyi TaxID=196109 RepID=A0A136IJ80_9PEZI|nr:hypothetical protein Micbo1qcDRAFT_170034 [Microdochium bolleyi]